jgi:hypothetical protein
MRNVNAIPKQPNLPLHIVRMCGIVMRDFQSLPIEHVVDVLLLPLPRCDSDKQTEGECAKGKPSHVAFAFHDMTQ